MFFNLNACAFIRIGHSFDLMKTILLASLLFAGLTLKTAAGEFVRLEGPPPRADHIYPLHIEWDSKGQIFSENGIPIATQIPSLRANAEQGDLKSQILLSKALDHRTTGSMNRIEAYKWAVIAASRGDTEAKSMVRALELFLTDAERATGRSGAGSFVPITKKAS